MLSYMSFLFSVFFVNMKTELYLLLSCLFSYLFMSSTDTLTLSNTHMFMDMMSKLLILLSIWISILSMLSINMKKKNQHNALMFMLLMTLVFTFMIKSMFFFFFLFESTLLPIFLIIMGWGYKSDRLQAALYLIFYMLFGSFPLFFFVTFMYMNNNLNFDYNSYGLLPFIMINTSFMIKFPLYSLHLWLLKAHLEAPVSGSMILAGILLKLGGYGFIRFSYLWHKLYSLMFDLTIMVSMWGAFIMSIVCMQMMDMKLMIAGSSVVHMNMCISSLMYFNNSSYTGSLMMMVSHGLISSGLFFTANTYYNYMNTRSLSICKGMMNLLPSISLWWFLLCSSNMSCPPSLSIWSEILIILNLKNWSLMILLPISFTLLFSAVYTLYLYSAIQHSSYHNIFVMHSKGIMVNHLITTLHWLPVNILFLTTIMFTKC